MGEHESGFDWTANQTVSGVIVNPGTGPVPGASVENAAANMEALIRDVDVEGLALVPDGGTPGTDIHGQPDGRYVYELALNGSLYAEVEMPGLPLAKVRFADEPGQNIWDFPRLYVDGSSWVWKYAVRILRDKVDDA